MRVGIRAGRGDSRVVGRVLHSHWSSCTTPVPDVILTPPARILAHAYVAHTHALMMPVVPGRVSFQT